MIPGWQPPPIEHWIVGALARLMAEVAAWTGRVPFYG